MNVYKFGWGNQVFATRELAEQWRQIDDILSDGESWDNDIHEVEVLDRLPQVTRKWQVYSNGHVNDRYIVEGETSYGDERFTFDTYEEALAAVPEVRKLYDLQVEKRNADFYEKERQEGDERWEKLKAFGVA